MKVKWVSSNPLMGGKKILGKRDEQPWKQKDIALNVEVGDLMLCRIAKHIISHPWIARVVTVVVYTQIGKKINTPDCDGLIARIFIICHT
ncbi:hypothetical protein [Salinibacillus kushneri]|uniref:hypothetical protein n=1 Tax=Salinibacillus kushneri TaxID=237682 RepID=UPI0015A5B70B|nr:hypothetical protein [Salinibacillus kushneri]